MAFPVMGALAAFSVASSILGKKKKPPAQGPSAPDTGAEKTYEEKLAIGRRIRQIAGNAQPGSRMYGTPPDEPDSPDEAARRKRYRRPTVQLMS